MTLATFVWAAVALVATVDGELPVEVARVDTAQAKWVDIVSQELSSDGRELTIVLKPKGDKFSVDFELDSGGLQDIKIIVRGSGKADMLRFFPSVKRPIFVDLNSMRGVSVDLVRGDCVIEFATPRAIKILPPGGRLLFRSAYEVAGEQKPERGPRGRAAGMYYRP